MYTGGAGRRASHLWQMPLLLLALALLLTTTGLYVDGRPVILLNQKLSVARELIHNDRPDAAAESVARLMSAGEPMPAQCEGKVHLLLAEALDAAQKQRKQSIPANHTRIIEQTQIALAQGVRPSGDIHRRLGESYEALGQPVEAVSQYRRAIAMDPARSLRLQRKVIDLQLAQNDWAPAESSLDAYLASSEIADAERAWALSVKAQLTIDRGDYAGAQKLLSKSLELDKDPIAQAEANYRLGVCAWKQGKLDDAAKLLAAARTAFRGQHPLDADAAYALGAIAQAKSDFAGAVALFDKIIAAYPDSTAAPAARFARGLCGIEKRGGGGGGDDDAAAVADVRASAVELAKSSPAMRAQVVTGLQKASALLADRENYQAAADLLGEEQAIATNPSSGYFQRLGAVYEKRARQVEQSAADAVAAAEKVRRQQLARDFTRRAGDAYLMIVRAKLSAGESDYPDAMWHAIDLYDRAANAIGAAAALEVFVSDHAADPIAPEALLRLAGIYESTGQADKAISAYNRLRGAYPKSIASAKAVLPLAGLLEKSPQTTPLARRALAELVDDADAAKRSPDDYRAALFELGSLCYRAGDVKDATLRLEQFVSQFPRDDRAGEAMFVLGECHLLSARPTSDAAQLASGVDDITSTSKELERTAGERKQHLAKAAEMFARCGETYSSQPPTRDADRRYQMLAELRRADCAYELGDYANAIASYQVTATRWADEPVALAASVQVVNAYRALNKLDEARTANERVRFLLAKMPQGAFADTGTPAGGPVMGKAYWNQWLRWSQVATASTW